MLACLVDQVQEGLRSIQPNQADAVVTRVVENLGVLVEVKAPCLIPLRLDLEHPKISVLKDVTVESVLQMKSAE